MDIRRIDDVDDISGEFINEEFSQYGMRKEIDLNYDEFCFVAEDDGNLIRE